LQREILGSIGYRHLGRSVTAKRLSHRDLPLIRDVLAMRPLSTGVGAKASVFALASEFRAACRTERSPRRPALRPQLAASGTRAVEFDLVSLVILGTAGKLHQTKYAPIARPSAIFSS
jgi:hypothetical protein